jgi:DNA polymerase-4
MSERTILHLDLDAFFCAVEEQRRPALRGRAFAVGGRPEQRGVVASCSYAARAFGVRSAMPMAQAVRLCPGLEIVPSRHGDYRRISRKVMALLRAVTPLIEPISIDEAFLDVSALGEPGLTIARRLQARIRDELGLPCSLGVATNKLVAKIATDVGKASVKGSGPPNAIQVVPPGEEAAFLAPLPVRALWGVGPKTAERLAELNIHTIGDIARWPPDDLIRRFGKHGADLAQRAKGIDTRPIETRRETKSISREVTFARDVRDRDQLIESLDRFAQSLGKTLQRKHLLGRTVKLKLRWADFTTLARQSTLGQPTDQTAVIYEAGIALFAENWPEGRPVRLIGLGVSNLTEKRQLGLWDEPPDDRADPALRATLEALRARFGEDIVQQGSDLLDEDA